MTKPKHIQISISDFIWLVSSFRGKQHFIFNVGDFSHSFCGKHFITKDLVESDEFSKFKTCQRLLKKENKKRVTVL